jgi:hypothetical protein
MRMLLAAATVAALTAAAPAAHAATPAEGEVSEAKLVQAWSGEADGQPLNNTPDTQTHQLCIAPFCDTFSLNVRDPGTALKVVFSAPSSAGFVDVLVIKPGGETERFGGTEDETTNEIVYEKPKPGAYTFDIWTNQFYGVLAGPYNAEATLCSATVKLADCFPAPAEEEEE